MNIMQTCIDYGAKYGKFQIEDEMVKWNTVAREMSSLACEVKQQLASRLGVNVLHYYRNCSARNSSIFTYCN